jgi:predicted nucleotidyltransferase
VSCIFAIAFLESIISLFLIEAKRIKMYIKRQRKTRLGQEIRGLEPMVQTKEQAVKIAVKAKESLEQIYGRRLRGIYLYGSAARGQLRPDSDIDIAIILDEITDKFDEYEKTSNLGSKLSLDDDTLVSFLFLTESDLAKGRFSIHQAIKKEGIRA